jgi:pyruvate, orthophosphate dikinase
MEAGTQVFAVGGQGGVLAEPEAMGFKAYNLARMARIGLPVPRAFVLETGFCRAFHAEGKLHGLKDLLANQIRQLESATGLNFGGSRKPLLVSVRSGAPVSMPGMMETLLNVGLNDDTLRGLLRMTGNPRLVWDSYRRLIEVFAEVVHGADRQPFDEILEGTLQRAGVTRPQELDFQSLAALARDYLALYQKLVGEVFPQGPMEQLEAAVQAVFRSWVSNKAVTYRRLHGLDDSLGTAVTVQRMVFGNAGGTSGAGVAFSRDPATGENQLYLDFLFNAQGEDVVSGRHTAHDTALLGEILPGTSSRLADVARMLEREFGDMQEFEFTIQDGELYLLQTRTGKRTPWAALKIAVEQAREGMIEPKEALTRLSAYDLDSIEQRRLRPDNDATVLCRATPASVGVATGAIALDSKRAEFMAAAGQRAVLVRADTSTQDIAGIAAAQGILTAVGGRTSHAAVVARQLNKVCLVGCSALKIDLKARRLNLAGRDLAEGDVLTLDANTGDIYAGEVQVEIEKPVEYLREVAAWGGA